MFRNRSDAGHRLAQMLTFLHDADVVVLGLPRGGVVVAAEATLTFSGVGLGRPTQSWGIQLYEAQDWLARAPHLLVPGVFVVVAVAGFVLLGEALRD